MQRIDRKVSTRRFLAFEKTLNIMINMYLCLIKHMLTIIGTMKKENYFHSQPDIRYCQQGWNPQADRRTT